jgi:hypothetical protein
MLCLGPNPTACANLHHVFVWVDYGTTSYSLQKIAAHTSRGQSPSMLSILYKGYLLDDPHATLSFEAVVVAASEATAARAWGLLLALTTT